MPNSDEKFDILQDIAQWESELHRLQTQEPEEIEQITEIKHRIQELNLALTEID